MEYLKWPKIFISFFVTLQLYRPVFQEIDGDALLLLKSEMMMKYLGLKLGPALKLCYHIDRLKQSRLWSDAEEPITSLTFKNNESEPIL